MSFRRFSPFRPRLEVLEDRRVPATFTVQTLFDSGPGSLRQAILNANNHAGLDTIVFKPGLEGTIRMSSNQEMEITESLVLAGPGASKITVDGNRATRIFNVDDGDLNVDSKVTIRGLALINGFKASSGGAIVSQEKLSLVQCIMSGNTVTGAFSSGGGIASFGKALLLQQCQLRDNRTDANGGGVFANGAVVIDRCTIVGNRASYGGGANAADGKLTVQRSTLSGNLASQRGGGIYGAQNLTNFIIANSQIAGNSAAAGGGVHSAAILTITSSRIAYNTASSSGGGLYASSGSLVTENCTITGNHAGLYGGGLFTVVPTIITGTKITFNRAESTAGGLGSNGLTNIQRSVISDNTSVGGHGGGISQSFGSLILLKSTVSRNHADSGFGGGVLLGDIAVDALIRGSTIAGNTAGTGGGMYIANCGHEVAIQQSTISGNRAITAGGIQTTNCSLLKVQNATIAFNRAEGSPGGGGAGGGIAQSSSIVDLVSTVVANNQSLGQLSDDLAGAFNAQASLIFTTVGATINDQNGNVFFMDPRLAPLANNGGPTQTHALRQGSPAVNMGLNPNNSAFDQRGAPFKRKLGSQVDIGAFERQ